MKLRFSRKITDEFPNGRPRFLALRRFCLRKPECLKYWMSLYFGAKRAGKTLHQSKEMLRVLVYLTILYRLYPKLPRMIITTNQDISQEVLEKYGHKERADKPATYGNYIFHWNDYQELHWCPRKNCWRGKKKHTLHGALIIFDDVSTILDPRNWMYIPGWLQKYFYQGGHKGVRCLATLVDPQVVDVSFRRCVDMAYQFSKWMGTQEPDEVLPKGKLVLGIYQRRKIPAKTLWQTGDLPEQTVRLMLLEREEQKKALEESGHGQDIVEDTSWFGSYHLFNKSGKFWPFGYFRLFRPVASTQIYDTLQDIKEYEPKGLICNELRCIDSKHIHPWDRPGEDVKELKKLPNFCDKVKKTYEVV